MQINACTVIHSACSPPHISYANNEKNRIFIYGILNSETTVKMSIEMHLNFQKHRLLNNLKQKIVLSFESLNNNLMTTEDTPKRYSVA